MFSKLDAATAKMTSGICSIVALLASIVAYFAVGGTIFSGIYITLVYILPKPSDVLVSNLNLLWGLLVGEAVGSIASGFVMFRIARRSRIISSAVVIALLGAMREGYILWGPNTPWELRIEPPLQMLLVCLSFFALGAWMGDKQTKTDRKIETEDIDQ